MHNENDILFLLEKVKKDDSGAFDELRARYTPLIEKYVRKYMFMLEADDLRQICSLALYRSACSYNFGDKVTFGSYAAVCIRNAVISALRAAPPSDICGDDENEVPQADIASSPEDEVIARENVRELIGSIKSMLSPYEQEILQMYLSGKSYTEMAAATGKSEASVGTALTRAKAKIRKMRE